MASIAYSPMKVLANSFVFCVMMLICISLVFGFFSKASKKKPQFKRLASLILSPESFKNRNIALSVALCISKNDLIEAKIICSVAAA
jgi:hypothetical protein